ncbi:MAG TPA: hypothetical protein VFE78_32695 [Gemmataceae bacterium]|jgi:hypothetical protein|nr:hypothetical protein [Gemmataceae bacterium]
MSPDPRLVDTIKTHFARKSSAQLQEIVQANNSERWSPEAVAAAGEVLRDRRAGRAREPEVAEAEPPPPPSHPDPFGLGFLALGALSGLGGFGIIPVYRVDYAGAAEPDLPVPFGPKMAWLALDTTDTEAVAAALGLRGARPATWAEGIEAAHRSSLFVTPPLADWTLAVGAALFPPDRAEAFVKPLLERLSRQFGEAQYFCTHQDFELHVWARARQGRLVRGYGWLGQKGLTLWDEGRQTREERDLGFRSFDGRPPVVEQGPDKSVTPPDEGGLMQLASLWSVDPTSLDEQFKEPLTGLLGEGPEKGTAWI